jgi:hypothetical protein
VPLLPRLQSPDSLRPRRFQHHARISIFPHIHRYPSEEKLEEMLDLILDDRIEQIRLYATNFRTAIESCLELRELLVRFKRFPHGCCGQATPMLAAYLHDKGLGKFEYVSGLRWNEASDWNVSTRHSHSWLEQQKLIVDITADQFAPEVTDPVLVTYGHSWHAQFNEDQFRHEADFRRNGWELKSIYRLYQAYPRLVTLADACERI